jgi:hypothetical protein
MGFKPMFEAKLFEIVSAHPAFRIISKAANRKYIFREYFVYFLNIQSYLS